LKWPITASTICRLKLNTLINKKKPKLILQVGDFGWWPRFDGKNDTIKLTSKGRVRVPWRQFGVKNPNTDIFWCPGNHECWDDLDLYNDAVKKGFKIKEVLVEHRARIGGESCMNLWGIIKMAWSLVEYSFS